jgi:hypothetical protein
MALHAGLELPLAIELRRIDDRAARRIQIPRVDRVNVGASRSVTPLAVDSFG